MTNSKLWIAVVVVAIIAIGAYGFPKTVIQQLGSLVGPDIYDRVTLHSGLVLGGGIRATSTNDTSATFLATDLVNNNNQQFTRIDFTPNVGSITATLPATSTLQNLVPKAGDTSSIKICNATSTATMPFTLAFGSGMNLYQATSTLAVGTGHCASVTFQRESDTDISVFYDLGY